MKIDSFIYQIKAAVRLSCTLAVMSDMSDEFHERVFGQHLRADALKSATRILVAADRLLRTNPYATLEEIGAEAGVSRTTIHRRFPTRRDLSIALSRWAVGRIVEALSRSKIGAAPAYVALYQATRNVIDVKVSLEYARSLAPPDDKVVRAYQGEMRRMADELLLQCRNEGIIRQDVDLDWARIMFYARVHEATGTESSSSTGQESDRLTRLVVDSLLHGVGSGHPHQQETGSHVEGAPIRQSRG